MSAAGATAAPLVEYSLSPVFQGGMMSSRFRIPALVALAVAIAWPAAAGDVSGKWKITSKSPRGERVSEIVLVQDGEKLTVNGKDREGNDVKSEGSVKGAEITWTTKRQGPMGEMVIVYKGKIEGKLMSGSSDFGQMGTGEWKAEKLEP
jgi:hypothetical protein